MDRDDPLVPGPKFPPAIELNSHETLGNISHLPLDVIETIRGALGARGHAGAS
jgi:hypothetical protein